MTVTKAVIPVAGFGTRMLPASKAIPKEMLPVVDKPAIQYVVEEAAAAGFRDIILVTHSAKKAIEDHFDTQAELEASLAAKGKQALLDEVRQCLPSGVRLAMVRQGQALGLGHAVACAAGLIGDAPFAVLLPDVLLDGTAGRHDMTDMVAAFEASGHAQVMVEAVAAERVDQYGIVSLQAPIKAGEGAPMTAVVEKPSQAEAPSNLAVVGRYLFPAAILPLLQQTRPGKGGEIQLTDAIDALIREGRADAWQMTGSTFDCGSKLGYLEAVLHFALQHPQLGGDVKQLLVEKVG